MFSKTKIIFIRAKTRRSSLLSLLLTFLALGFAACGGGGNGATTFTVGGTVTGLTATLVLQNTGVDDLTLTEDGAFTFATGLEDGATYAVTILTQPTDQLCTISNASGSIAAADVSDVTVSCGAFVVTATGAVQKGPFRNGSSVIIVELNEFLEASGSQFNTSTINDLGHFTTNAQIDAQFVEVITQGFFFDEVSNGLSSAELTLRTISEFVAGEIINVNILTQLASRRVEALVLTGSTFADALDQPQGEVLGMFNIDPTGISDFDTLDITGTGDGNAVLLAVSAVLMQAAVTADSNNTAAQISQLMANIGTDFSTDGVLDDAGIIDQVRQAGIDVDLTAVRANLEAEYESQGETLVAATFEDFVDQDGDDLVQGVDDNLPDTFEATAIPAITNAVPASLNFTDEIAISEVTGNVRVSLQGGRLIHTLCGG